MSRYSGKCDLYDMLDGYDDSFIANSKFYIDADYRSHKLDIHTRKDCIPYYPYIVGMCGIDVKNNNGTFHLGTKPYYEEERTIDDETKQLYRKELYEYMIKNGFSEIKAYQWCFPGNSWNTEKMMLNIGKVLSLKTDEISEL